MLRLVATMLAFLVLAMVAITDAAAPTSYPLYEELGLTVNATSEDIDEAYRQYAQTWTTDRKYAPVEIQKIIEIEHAYHVLSNNLSRRDYDNLRIDVLQSDAENIKQLYKGKTEAEYLKFPLWQPIPLGNSIKSRAETVTYQNFGSVMSNLDPFLIQIYSDASPDCHAFAPVWDTVGDLLDGVVRVGRLELGEVPLTIYLAERNFMRGYPFFRNGLPAIFAVQSGCGTLDCIDRYYGERSSDAIADWVGTRLLRLPRILYYTAQTLVTDIIQKPAPHKIKVIQFSDTGQRAPLYLRKAARDYWAHAVFAMVLWRKSETTFWERKVGVEYGPATVFLKDPGLPPVIHHGKLSSTSFRPLLEEHKTFELPQLRSISAADLGCDVSKYSLAGKKAKIWYCVIVAGRPGLALSQHRGVLREAQHLLMNNAVQQSPSISSVEAFKDKRLRLAWLDGEIQKEFCYFYLNSESMFESCGPAKYELQDIPSIFLIRYIRNDTVVDSQDEKKRWLPKSVWEKQTEEEKNYAAQLVTKYNGSSDASEIVNWLSVMVTQGDNEDLPSFRGKAPDLIAEEAIPFTAISHEFVAEKRDRLLDFGKRLFRLAEDFQQDPKFMPLVLSIVVFYTAACFFGAKHRKILAKEAQKEKAVVEGSEDIGNTPMEESSTSTIETSAEKHLSAISGDGLRRRDTFQRS